MSENKNHAVSYFGRGYSGWADTSDQHVSKAESAKSALNELLVSSLNMQHIIVLVGSGASLGDVGGPTMWKLWCHCVYRNPEESDEDCFELSAEAKKVIDTINFGNGEKNIEALLSWCDAYLQIRDDKYVSAFVTAAKSTILKLCSEFIQTDNVDQLGAHEKFLRRMSRRRARDSRLKLFTTNYDLCFETAASRQGLVAIDGFSFSQPRLFDPKFFAYDIVRRSNSGDDVGMPLEGVFHLCKLHGSVNWSRNQSREILVNEKPNADEACLIYPARGKFQQSYAQPYLELMSQYLAALRQPNTCVVVVGFGFNDDHLSEPILAAVQSNPHLRLIVAGPGARRNAEGGNNYWKELAKLAKANEDVCLINADFQTFAGLIPDLQALTPAQKLMREIKNVAGV
jgi:SIR2-like domain